LLLAPAQTHDAAASGRLLYMKMKKCAPLPTLSEAPDMFQSQEKKGQKNQMSVFFFFCIFHLSFLRCLKFWPCPFPSLYFFPLARNIFFFLLHFDRAGTKSLSFLLPLFGLHCYGRGLILLHFLSFPFFFLVGGGVIFRPVFSAHQFNVSE
jgi:hypothetical protein